MALTLDDRWKTALWNPISIFLLNIFCEFCSHTLDCSLRRSIFSESHFSTMLFNRQAKNPTENRFGCTKADHTNTPNKRLYKKGDLKVLETFQSCSHRTTLISFALGACSGAVASNAWQEMSQCDGGWSLAFSSDSSLSQNESGIQAGDSLYRLICLNRKRSCFINLFKNSLNGQCIHDISHLLWIFDEKTNYKKIIWRRHGRRLISLSKALVTTNVRR